MYYLNDNNRVLKVWLLIIAVGLVASTIIGGIFAGVAGLFGAGGEWFWLGFVLAALAYSGLVAERIASARNGY